jgi:hypothetical protein
MTDQKVPPTPVGYVTREDVLLQRCAGKSVLHLGFLGETNRPLQERLEHVQSGHSLDARLRRAARRVVGVDLNEEAISYLRSHGVDDVYAGNVEELDRSDVPRTPPFDIIIAGDIIEHLSNPGLMLQGIKNFVTADGEIIVTTPNAFGLPNYLRFLKGSFREGPDHVQSYSALTLSHLLQRYGWEISALYCCYESRARELNNPVAFYLGRWLLQRIPKLGGTLLAISRPRRADD